MRKTAALLAGLVALAIAPAASAPAAAQHVALIRHGHVVLDGKPFFPIMQWLQCPWLFKPNAALGVNTFLGIGCEGTTGPQELAATTAASGWSVLPTGTPGAGESLLGWHF